MMIKDKNLDPGWRKIKSYERSCSRIRAIGYQYFSSELANNDIRVCKLNYG